MPSQKQNINPEAGRSRGKIDNVLYNVITVLHEKSKGLEAYDKYEKDLQNNREVAEVFEEVRRNDEQSVQRLEECLTQLISQRAGRGERAA